MQQEKQRRQGVQRKWPFVVAGVAVLAVVVTGVVIFQLVNSSAGQAGSSIITYATAAKGDVATTVTGSGTLGESSSEVSAPIGVKVTNVFVTAGDEIVSGDVVASVDVDSVAETIDLVTEERDSLSSASAALGGSASIDRMIAAYGVVLDNLNELRSSGYIRAKVSGVIGTVNIKKGDTISASTGASASNGSGSDGSGSDGSGSNGSDGLGNSGYTPASYNVLASSAAEGSWQTAALDVPGSGDQYFTLASASISKVATEAKMDTEAAPLEVAPLEAAPTSASYEVSALPYAVTTLAKLQGAAAAALPSQSKEDAIKAYLVQLFEAQAWETTNPATPTPAELTVDLGEFTLKKGVYSITFSSLDDSFATVTSYLVVESDAQSGGDNNGAATPGDGTTNPGSNGSVGNGGNSDIDTDSFSGSGGTGGSGGSGAAGAGGTGSDNASEAVFGSTMAPALTILANDAMEVKVQLDELDVAAVQTGQKATVELNALDGQTFEGTVSSVSLSNNSYYAIVKMKKTEEMYVGFSATATIVKAEAKDVVIIPLDAVQQRAGELFVYTATNDSGELSGEVVVTTGLSDESTVEITQGLSEGITVYYRQFTNSSVASTGSNQTRSFSMDGGEAFMVGPSGGGPGGSGFAMRQ